MSEQDSLSYKLRNQKKTPDIEAHGGEPRNATAEESQLNPAVYQLGYTEENVEAEVAQSEQQSASIDVMGEISQNANALITIVNEYIPRSAGLLKTLDANFKRTVEHQKASNEKLVEAFQKKASEPREVDISDKKAPEEKSFMEKIKDTIVSSCGIAKNILFDAGKSIVKPVGAGIIKFVSSPVGAGLTFGAGVATAGAGVAYMASKYGEQMEDEYESAGFAKNEDEFVQIAKRVAGPESNGKWSAKNPYGTASGKYQITNEWIPKINKEFGKSFKPSDKQDPQKGEQIFEYVARLMYRDVKKRANKSSFTPGEVYTLWFLGNDALNVFKGTDGNKPITSFIKSNNRQAIISQNRRYLFKGKKGEGEERTLSEFRNFMEGKMGGSKKRLPSNSYLELPSDISGYGWGNPDKVKGSDGRYKRDTNYKPKLSQTPIDTEILKHVNVTSNLGKVSLFGLQGYIKRLLLPLAEFYHNATGKKLQLSSGYRTKEEQERIYRNNNSHNPAKAGTSPHETGEAIDIGSDANQIGNDILAHFGFVRPVRNDDVHLEAKNHRLSPMKANYNKRPTNKNIYNYAKKININIF